MRENNSSNPDDLRRRFINLANSRLNARVLFATDDFFAPKERMLNPEEPVFIAGKYDNNGKWMDGWESRRKRTAGHDFSIIKLGVPGVIRVIDIDTRHFTGNYPPAASIDACYSETDPHEQTKWTGLLSKSELAGDSHNLFELKEDRTWNYLRLNIYPDGGIARLRVYGHVYFDWDSVEQDTLLDLAAIVHGGRAISCNDEHFGAMHNIIMPGKGINMGDGWETRRRREPGNDWVILQLGHPGMVKRVEIDTAFFKGNYPDTVSVDGALLKDNDEIQAIPADSEWQEIMPEQKLSADNLHIFEHEITSDNTFSHVRININPDGGLSRVRIRGCVRR